MPEDTLTPLLLALAILAGFAGLFFAQWIIASLGLLATIGLIIVWLWPRKSLSQTPPDAPVEIS